MSNNILSYFPIIPADLDNITNTTIESSNTSTTNIDTAMINISSPVNEDNNNTNYFNTKKSLDREDFSQDMFYLKHVRYLNEENRAPVLFVFDFDNTLAVYDEHQHLQLHFSDSFPSVYTRPFLYEMLDYMKATNKHNILILWSAGKGSYIQNILTLLNLGIYFNHILTYYDCIVSRNKYGVNKSYKYIITKYPQYSDMRSILIDNWAVVNATGRKRKNYGTEGRDRCGRTTKQQYSHLISIKPYTIRDVAKEFGAFNIPPHKIINIDTFIHSKGLYGKIIGNNDTIDELPGNFQVPSYGDTALLSLICFCENVIFGMETTKIIKNEKVQEKIQSDYYIIVYENNQLMLINKKEAEKLSIQRRQCRPLVWMQITPY
ncbi:hypothetical protein TCON_1621 [Astathelohania contejeani]|uniref:FCP1 homology domain-containing protein n=1 Tax=Astathelohania contejeani TaxID=164912 RepID=A0ABQ7HYF0_9MICR|nr:hypothetical protein TCON_1621 [Thelohania contejeani]